MTAEQIQDPLRLQPGAVERVNYATGLMLDTADFLAEQTYHRSRLARALSYLHGYGTIAGLEVGWSAATDDAEEMITVQPGIALDRLGRLIEVPKEYCIRLNRWYEGRDQDEEIDELVQARKGPPVEGVVIDVFLTFETCDSGLTPAFATGPFDALDAVVPSRLRDSYRLELVPRTEPDPGLPGPQWPDLAALPDAAARTDAAKAAILAAWRTEPLAALQEDVFDRDPASLFLARLVLPATEAPAGQRPQRTGQPVTVDNLSRAFVYSEGVLASIAGLGV